jgi:Protein tyrosine/serine phosphatase
MQNNRYFKLDGAYNFRDVGGIKTAEGKILKQGVLFRSDELSKLSNNDLTIIKDLKIKTICDLRTNNEIKSHKDRIPQNLNISLVNIPLSDQNREVSHLQFFLHLTFQNKKIDFEKFITDHYYRNAFERTGQIKKIFSLLANANNLPLLIHCTVGKDRTGLTSALVQLLCGVSKEDVLQDYLLTNKYIEPRIKKITDFIKWMSLFQISAKKLKPVLEARYDYMNTILEAILAKYFTIENYLSDGCGIDKENLNKIKNIMLS